MCIEDCGRLQPPDEHELVEAFRLAVTDAFAFLVSEHRLHASALLTFCVDGDGRRTPAPAAQVRYPFLAVLEFTGDNPPVRIGYGERDYRFDVEIGANGRGYHPLAAWLDSLGIEFDSADDSGVPGPAALERHARRLARELRDHYEEMKTAASHIIERLGAREARAPARLNRIRDRAHSAFADGDYACYIEMLEPFETALTLTEQRKLEFARGKRAA